MKKVTVTLRSGPYVSLEFPEEYRPARGADLQKVERSCYGAVRLYPGLPKAISASELAYLEAKQPELAAKLLVRPYVESRRVDKRGCSEAELERLAEQEGLSHLVPARQLEVLKQRGKLQSRKPLPKPVQAAPKKKASSSKQSAE